MNQIFSKPALLASAALFAAAAIAACHNDSTGPGASAAAIAASKTPPAGPIVASAVTGPSVLVSSSGGTPVAGAVVTFTVTAGGGVIQYSTATTDAQGVASAGLWQIGPKVGVNTVTATVEGVTPLSFSVTSQPGAAAKVAVFAGDAQTGAPGSTTSSPLSARVTDAGGNVKPGEVVTFGVVAGGGSIAGATATTDAQGIATSGAWTFGSCRGQVVQAQLGALSATFTGLVTGQPAIAVGGSAAGTLTTTDCVINGAYADEYDLTTAAEAVLITLTSTTFDALLNILNGAATIPIATNDNESSASTNSSVKLIAAATTKTVTATSAAPGQTGGYTLSVASTSADVSTCGTTYIEIGATTSQSVSATDCGAPNAYDEYKVYLAAGTPLRIDLNHGGGLDGYLMLISPSGTTLLCADDNQPNAQERISFSGGAAGYYTIRASAWGLAPPGACDGSGYRYDSEFAPYTLTLTP